MGSEMCIRDRYYRRTRDFTMVRDEAGFARMFEHMHSLSIDMVMRDTQAMLDYVDAQPAALGLS